MYGSVVSTVWFQSYMAPMRCSWRVKLPGVRDAYAQYRSEVCLTYDDALAIYRAAYWG